MTDSTGHSVTRKTYNRTFQFGREFPRFLAAHPDLDRWFNNKVTSAFLCPWRTEHRYALYRLDNDTKDKLFQFSSQLVWKMIEHHEAKVIVVGADKGVHPFNELFKRNGEIPLGITRKLMLKARRRGMRSILSLDGNHSAPDSTLHLLESQHTRPFGRVVRTELRLLEPQE